MTKTESAHLTAQTVLIESAEEALQISGAAGVRLAIPDTDALIMVGPADWIAKNVPGVEAMVEPGLVAALSAALNHARDALRFYAEKSHFHMHQPDEWDTVSGEPQNLYEDSSNTATVEDGTVAKLALEDIAFAARLAATTQASTAQAEASAWISVDERLPEKYCLASYRTSRGMQRTIRAMHVKQYEIEANGDECDSETNDADDMEYIKAGWYECIDNWGDYSSVKVNEGTVTHWMPLPPAPVIRSAGDTGSGE